METVQLPLLYAICANRAVKYDALSAKKLSVASYMQ